MTEPYPELRWEAPCVTPYSATLKYVWGDDESGHTTDWIYVSTEEISQVVFGMPSGAGYAQSAAFKDSYESDVVWRVLEGLVAVLDPDTGEVGCASEGESFFFAGRMRRFVYSVGAGPARLLEFSVPSAIASTRYSWDTSEVDEPRWAWSEYLGRWPKARGEHRERARVTVVSPRDVLWTFAGPGGGTLVGVIASTPRLTAYEVYLRPGQRSDAFSHDGPASLYTEHSALAVELTATHEWLELDRRDGAFLPPATAYQLVNLGSEVATSLVQVVAPSSSSH